MLFDALTMCTRKTEISDVIIIRRIDETLVALVVGSLHRRFAYGSPMNDWSDHDSDSC